MLCCYVILPYERIRNGKFKVFKTHHLEIRSALHRPLFVNRIDRTNLDMAKKHFQRNKNEKQLHSKDERTEKPIRLSPKSSPQLATLKPYSLRNQSTQPNPVHTSRPPHTATLSAQQWPFPGAETFLNFPGEIRNMIYGYVFPRELYEICCLDKSAKSLTYRFGTQPSKGPRLDPSVVRRRRLWDYPRRIRSNEHIPLYELSPGPAAILLTCKQIHEEASSLLYNNSTFTFSSLRALSTFLNTIRISCKQSIRSLHLKHYTAGNLGLTNTNKGQEGYDQKWLDLCWKVRHELCNLKELSIVLTINDTPLVFGEEATWKAPLLAFSGIGLKRCSIVLKGRTIDTVLEVEAYKLCQFLLGDNFLSGGKAHSFWFEEQKW